MLAYPQSPTKLNSIGRSMRGLGIDVMVRATSELDCLRNSQLRPLHLSDPTLQSRRGVFLEGRHLFRGRERIRVLKSHTVRIPEIKGTNKVMLEGPLVRDAVLLKMCLSAHKLFRCVEFESQMMRKFWCLGV